MSDGRRMTADQRRLQLLSVALDLVRREGTAELTLSRVAEAAGVTKPIAYGHFGNRTGLLKALYLDYDHRQNAAMREAVAGGGGSLDAVAEIVATAYVDCVLSAGPEMGAITAALSATEDMEAFREALREEYLQEFRAAFSPYGQATSPAEYLGIFGACEVLAQAAALGRLSRQEAAGALKTIIVGILRAAPSGGSGADPLVGKIARAAADDSAEGAVNDRTP